ncbi:MAG: response regulator transcription factor [Chloroflexi bacterium]|jgi:DNA-binding NarL/FixJ family response regulator|nr:response regulator transcription factor [Chloroflexota bacterium]MBT3669464.1 response regulator transcription factor [Chloroflexota bacterium]MBT4003242.1 response regulator transcription factor [Chloroflexota bacterium]MBT4304517.1 response regulator transcription factor [Chloroflexota bacterium]MBT4534142.1 response regulator transcription factor [Chloroflexota bacterium]
MRKTHVLIVDDHQGVLQQIENLLVQETDFELCKAVTLDKAKSHVLLCKPEILLIDPYVNGNLCIDSLAALQELLPSMIIIVLAAVVDAATELALSRIGIKFILEKKIAPEQLLDTLRLVEKIHAE